MAALGCQPLCSFSERLYFTTFSQPLPTPEHLNRTDSYKTLPQIRGRSRGGTVASPEDDTQYYYFTVDDDLVYLSFYEDWGPLNLAMVYKACILIHELLENKKLKSHRLVLYSSDDPRRKANAALLMALFVMIVLRQAPWEAFHPIAEMEFMPFRDAGRGRSDFNLSIQDCLWGVWKAMQNGLCDMNEFSLEEYEYYEKVENGDWNWITPNFIAFASPVDPSFTRRMAGGDGGLETALQRKLPAPFLNCLEYFDKRGVKLVVRLNNPLYDKTVFTERGIDHLELYFDDGTNPSDEIVRKFIQMSDAIIEQKGVIAIHCKAGLGRTGTLIGAYLIWKYGFTANEAIAFMRIVRPGCVVGPQQQYLYVKQLEWVRWSAVDEIQRAKAAAAVNAISLTPTREGFLGLCSTTPPPPITPHHHVLKSATAAQAIATPGQPRKTPVAKRHRNALLDVDEGEEEEEIELRDMNGAVPPVRKSPRTSNANRAQAQPKTNGATSSSSSAANADTAAATITAATAANTTTDPTASTRTTRSATNARKNAGATGGGTTNGNGNINGVAVPNKIPRLAKNASTGKSAADHPVARRRPPGSPVGTAPSRLPTLVGRRALAPASNFNIRLRSQGPPPPPAPDAWMNKDSSAIVVHGSKADAPILRSVRRRRSSFSAADVVA